MLCKSLPLLQLISVHLSVEFVTDNSSYNFDQFLTNYTILVLSICSSEINTCDINPVHQLFAAGTAEVYTA